MAVQMWRSALMHTGRPRPVFVSGTATRYRGLLHWGMPPLPHDLHAKVTGSRADRS